MGEHIYIYICMYSGAYENKEKVEVVFDGVQI